MRVGTFIILGWFLIGAIAAVQRGYFSSDSTSCTHIGSTAITVVAGPLNFFGVDPRIKCGAPEPS